MKTGKPRTDLRQRIGGRFLRMINPLARRLIAAGLPTGAPNVLLTTRGRRTGKPRTVPVGMIQLDDRRFVQASYGEGGWVQNVRVSDEATVIERNQPIPVHVVELTAEDAAEILQRALASYRRSRLLRVLLGPRFRPPIGVLTRLRIRIDDTRDEYIAEARRHPVFELRAAAAATRS